MATKSAPKIGDTRYAMAPYYRAPHILKSESFSVFSRGAYDSRPCWRSSWGYRLECTVCGAVEEHAVSTSVACEDAPGRFAWTHRECVAV